MMREMTTLSSSPRVMMQDAEVAGSVTTSPRPEIAIGLLTGGGDRHYAFGLAMALVAKGVSVDFIGGDEVDSPELHCTRKLNFLNLRHNGRQDASLASKVSRTLMYYARLIRYSTGTRARLFHILWNNKFEFFDRTLLMLYYKLLRKKITLTAHNVNAGRRDSTDTWINRLTLGIQYRLADHIFVHTDKMKAELQEQFGVANIAVSVIPYGINNAAPNTDLTPAEAKLRLGIKDGERTLLFFGNIAPYKGLQYLIAAFEQLVAEGGSYRLIVVGRAQKGSEKYVDGIRQMLSRDVIRGRTIRKIEFIPDDEIELYFKAADVSVLPYTHIFQSGVLFLGYSFGLPVIASDVGSLRQDIIEGKTGLVFHPKDAADLAHAIEKYFASDLYQCLNIRRQQIQSYVQDGHSWDVIGEMTRNVYTELLGK
jgi:glycosyltransferase involved in cell wall biosynthesis